MVLRVELPVSLWTDTDIYGQDAVVMLTSG